ncbi:hypothetical protein [Rhodoblastus sp.]|nr:hypothetical protein [Rhodoblastus sp.]
MTSRSARANAVLKAKVEQAPGTRSTGMTFSGYRKYARRLLDSGKI